MLMAISRAQMGNQTKNTYSKLSQKRKKEADKKRKEGKNGVSSK
jgi:hypothetical protein